MKRPGTVLYKDKPGGIVCRMMMGMGPNCNHSCQSLTMINTGNGSMIYPRYFSGTSGKTEVQKSRPRIV